MVELRRRQGRSPEDDEGPSDSPPASSPVKNKPSTEGSASGGRKPLIVLSLFLLAITVGYTIIHRLNHPYLGSPKKPRIYSAAELAQFTGRKKHFTPAWWPGRRGGPILLGCMGKVFDVTTGHRHYGPKGGYFFFSGKDASRSFVTGDFKNDLTDDIADLRSEDIAAMLQWRDFYESHKEYKFVGVVAGRFYNAQGEALPLLHDVEKIVEEYKAQEAVKEAAAANVAEVLCNVSWKKSEGGWVYCQDGMVPRKAAIPTTSSLQNNGGVTSVQERCVCVDSNEKVTEGRRVYDGCRAESSRCQTSLPDEF